MPDNPTPAESAVPAAPAGPIRSRAQRRNGARRTAAVTVPLAVLASGWFVYQASNAAFTATTSNPGNNWTAGNVQLSDSQNGTALFNVTNVLPALSNAASKCIKVTYNGNVAAKVKMYLTNWTGTNRSAGTFGAGDPGGSDNLASYMYSIIQEGTGNNANCSDFVAGGAPNYETSGTTNGEKLDTFRQNTTAWGTSDYDGGAHVWNVTGGETKTFKVTYWLPDKAAGDPGAPATQAAEDDLQGSSLSVRLVWEARSN